MTRSRRNAPEDDEREERIANEIVVDCYNEAEVWWGWWNHLDGRLPFPFTAECIATRRGSPLRVGEQVRVTGMFDDDGAAVEALTEMKVEIEWQERTLAAPLAQLRGVDVGDEAAEAIADWHYWAGQGRLF